MNDCKHDPRHEWCQLCLRATLRDIEVALGFRPGQHTQEQLVTEVKRVDLALLNALVEIGGLMTEVECVNRACILAQVAESMATEAAEVIGMLQKKVQECGTLSADEARQVYGFRLIKVGGPHDGRQS